MVPLVPVELVAVRIFPLTLGTARGLLVRSSEQIFQVDSRALSVIEKENG